MRIRTFSRADPSVRIVQLALIVAAACLSLLFDARTSYACTCAKPGPSPSEALEAASLVFSGEVLDRDDFKILGPIYERDGNVTVRSIERIQVIYTVKVSRIWKGEVDEITYLSVYDALNSCAGGASVGSRYLVYDGLRACSRTRLLSSASQDLAELGPGRTPIPGTSRPVPEIMKESSDTVIRIEDQSRESKTPSPTPDASDKQTSPPWPVFVLASVPSVALIGLLVLRRIRVVRRSER